MVDIPRIKFLPQRRYRANWPFVDGHELIHNHGVLYDSLCSPRTLAPLHMDEMLNLKDNITIRSVTPADAAAIAEIYNHYVNQTIITFEEKPVSLSEVNKRIQDVLSLALPWFIAALDNEIVGYAYASKWKERTAYRFSVEVTVYVRPDHLRHGIGFQLYNELLPALKAKGVHAAMGGIALPNKSSARLHEKFGFEKVAHFKEVGFKFDRWIDVGYWECIL